MLIFFQSGDYQIKFGIIRYFMSQIGISINAIIAVPLLLKYWSTDSD